MPAAKAYTASELAEKLGANSQTIRSVLETSGIDPLERTRRNAKLYPVSRKQMDEIRDKLKARQGGQQSLPLDLKEAKLAEEVEHLKLKNRKLRDEATPNRIIAEILGGLSTFTAGLLTQKLEIEWPVQVAGMEPAEIRETSKKTNDEIRARYRNEYGKWKKYSVSDNKILLSQNGNLVELKVIENREDGTIVLGFE